jgi:hypothetical protein
MKNLPLVSSVLLSLMLPNLAHAIDPPLYCRYGKVKASQPDDPAECSSEVPSVRQHYFDMGLCDDSDGFSNNDMDGYLEIGHVGTYLLIGSEVNIKADGNWLANGNGGEERITYWDSLVGYVAEKRTGFEGNTFHKYTLSGGPTGPGHVWVINNEYYNVCSKKAVYFQRAPVLTVTAFNATTGMATVHYEIDPYSKNAVEGIASEIVTKATSAMYGETSGKQKLSGTSGSLMLQLGTGYYAGNYSFSVSISDGTYTSAEVPVGTVSVPCHSGDKKIVQTSPGFTGFDAAQFCGQAPKGGASCQYSIRPLANHSYPPLEYTCR